MSGEDASLIAAETPSPSSKHFIRSRKEHTTDAISSNDASREVTAIQENPVRYYTPALFSKQIGRYNTATEQKARPRKDTLTGERYFTPHARLPREFDRAKLSKGDTQISGITTQLQESDLLYGQDLQELESPSFSRQVRSSLGESAGIKPLFGEHSDFLSQAKVLKKMEFTPPRPNINRNSLEASRWADSPSVPYQEVPSEETQQIPKLSPSTPPIKAAVMANVALKDLHMHKESIMETPRKRKRLVWNGRQCTICLPGHGPEIMGRPFPMTRDDMSSMLDTWDQLECELADENKFISASQNGDFRDTCNSNIDDLPSEEDSQYNVRLPDSKRWQIYVDWLMEEKLRALGVGAPEGENESKGSRQFSPSTHASALASMRSTPALSNSASEPHSQTISSTTPSSSSYDSQRQPPSRASRTLHVSPSSPGYQSALLLQNNSSLNAVARDFSPTILSQQAPAPNVTAAIVAPLESGHVSVEVDMATNMLPSLEIPINSIDKQSRVIHSQVDQQHGSYESARRPLSIVTSNAVPFATFQPFNQVPFVLQAPSRLPSFTFKPQLGLPPMPLRRTSSGNYTETQSTFPNSLPRHASLGSLNVAAAAFEPQSFVPQSKDFSFSSGYTFRPDAKPFQPIQQTSTQPIFGNIPAAVDQGPTRRLKPAQLGRNTVTTKADDSDLTEDESGRLVPRLDRQKRAFKVAHTDGNEIPLFATRPASPIKDEAINKFDLKDMIGENESSSQPVPDVKSSSPIMESAKDTPQYASVHNSPRLSIKSSEANFPRQETTHAYAGPTEAEQPFRSPTVEKAMAPVDNDLEDLDKGHESYTSAGVADQEIEIEYVLHDPDQSTDELLAIVHESAKNSQASPRSVRRHGRSSSRSVRDRSISWSSNPRSIITHNTNAKRHSRGDINLGPHIPTLIHDHSDQSDVDRIHHGENEPNVKQSLQHAGELNKNDDRLAQTIQTRLQPLQHQIEKLHEAFERGRPVDSNSLTRRLPSAVRESDADDEDDDEAVANSSFLNRSVSRPRGRTFELIRQAISDVLLSRAALPDGSAMREEEYLQSLDNINKRLDKILAKGLDADDVREAVDDALLKSSTAIVHVSRSPNTVLPPQDGFDEKKLLRLAEEELDLLRASIADKEGAVNALERERVTMRERLNAVEDSKFRLVRKLDILEAENVDQGVALEEYRASRAGWRADMDKMENEKQNLRIAVTDLNGQLADSNNLRDNMRDKIDRIHTDMAAAAEQLASQKAIWQRQNAELQKQYAILQNRVEAEMQLRNNLDIEIGRLRPLVSEGEVAKSQLTQMIRAKILMEETVSTLRDEINEKQISNSRVHRELQDARENSRIEVQRAQLMIQASVASVKSEAEASRAGLESKLSIVQTQLANNVALMEAMKTRHEVLIQEEADLRRDTLLKVNEASSTALEAFKKRHEEDVQYLHLQKDRVVEEMKQDQLRSEGFWAQRMNMAEEKSEHLKQHIIHLEDRLIIAKEAATAAVQAAKSATLQPQSSKSLEPERVSPQALRESILTLQEQLEDRQASLERSTIMKSRNDETIKRQTAEISWLRELHVLRSDDLNDLIACLSSEDDFDRIAARDAGIRIQTSMKMYEKQHLLSTDSDELISEQSGNQESSLPQQALSTLTAFASPKAAHLAAAIGNWRARGAPSLPPRQTPRSKSVFIPSITSSAKSSTKSIDDDSSRPTISRNMSNSSTAVKGSRDLSTPLRRAFSSSPSFPFQSLSSENGVMTPPASASSAKTSLSTRTIRNQRDHRHGEKGDGRESEDESFLNDFDHDDDDAEELEPLS